MSTMNPTSLSTDSSTSTADTFSSPAIVTTTVPDEIETETVTIQTSSFTTSTITETVLGLPGNVYTTKTSVFPTLSDASFPETWMTATGTLLSKLLSELAESSETGATDMTSSDLANLSASTMDTTSTFTSSIGTEGSSTSSLPSSPASVSATTTSLRSTPSSTLASGSAISESSGGTLTSCAAVTAPPTTFETSVASGTTPSMATSTSSDASPGDSVIPVIFTNPAFSADCPTTVDCATWSPTGFSSETVPDTTSEIAHASPVTRRAALLLPQKRDASCSALDTRGYGLLVAWFLVGIVCGIACVLVSVRLRTLRGRQKSNGKRSARSPERSGHSLRDHIGSRRRGSTSPTHVSGVESLSLENLTDTQLLRRSWQEDSVV